MVVNLQYPRVARRFANMPMNCMLTVVGTVLARPPASRNTTMPTGDIEVEVEDIINIEYGSKRRGAEKRSYSTMCNIDVNKNKITSTEYKMASKLNVVMLVTNASNFVFHTESDNILKYFENREVTCNDLGLSDVGRNVTLVGWIASTNTTKFQQLKDGYGYTQVVLENETVT